MGKDIRKSKINSVDRKVDQLKCEFNKFKKETNEKLDNMLRGQVISYLQEKNELTNKHVYSYEDIGSILGCSRSFVWKVALDTGLSRRIKNVD